LSPPFAVSRQANLFLIAKRNKTRIFLEPTAKDSVQTVVDTIAKLVNKNPDDVAICFNKIRLTGSQVHAPVPHLQPPTHPPAPRARRPPPAACLRFVPRHCTLS